MNFSFRPLYVLIYALAMLSLLGLPCSAASKIMINEVFVDGSSNYPDWIELFNAGDTSSSLGGYRLSDDLDDTGWAIPETFSIAPGQYKVFICDKRNAYDHTNFRLKSIAGQVYLLTPSGELADQIEYDSLPRFSSIGRYPDGKPQWFVHSTPTMESKNTQSRTPVAHTGTADSLHISHASGLYDKPFMLTMQPPPGTKVRYTLDGSIPTMESRLYANALKIDSTTIIRIAVITSDHTLSTPETRSYFIGESTELPLISLVTDPKNLWDPEIGIYAEGDSVTEAGTQSHNWQRKWRRPVHIDFMTKTEQWSIDGNCRIFGGASRGRPQKSFAVYADDKNTPYGIEHRLFPDTDRERYAGFILRNGGDAWLRTQFRDAFQQALIQDRAEVESMRYRPVLVFINGTYWGVYGLREAMIKKNLLAGRDLPLQPVKILNNRGISSKKGPFSDFKSVPVQGEYRPSLPSLDIDSYLDYLAIELYSGNIDWPDGNIKVWRPLTTPKSTWRWILYDLDRGFNGKRGKSAQEDPFVELLRRPGPRGLHFSDLIKNDLFVRDFCSRLTVHILTTFRPERALSILNRMVRMLRPEMERHWERWHWSWQLDRLFMNMDRWEEYLATLRQFCEQRPSAMMRIMDKHFKTGTPLPTSLTIMKQGKGRIMAEGLVLPDGKLTGLIPENIKIRIEAQPAPGYIFAGWENAPRSTDPYKILEAGTSVTDRALFSPIDNEE